MKLFKTILLISAIAGGMVLSCSDESDNPMGGNGNPPSGTGGQVTMTIGGGNWTSSTAAADTAGNGGIAVSFAVAGSRIPQADGISFGFADLTGIKEQTYNFTPGSGGVVTGGYINPTDTSQTAWIDPTQSNVTISITSLNYTDRHVSGTFSIDLYKTNGIKVEVRNGIFSKVPLTQ
jgi:hypothetical protein